MKYIDCFRLISVKALFIMAGEIEAMEKLHLSDEETLGELEALEEVKNFKRKFTSDLEAFHFQKDTVTALPTVPIGAPSENSPGVWPAHFNKYRGSISWTEGFEKNLHILAKDQYPDRAMGVFTSGGDAQGNQGPTFIEITNIQIE